MPATTIPATTAPARTALSSTNRARYSSAVEDVDRRGVKVAGVY